jgi:hypothetical protein
MTDKKDQLLNFVGLYEKRDRHGNPCFSGRLNTGVRVLMLRNGFKTQPNHPDYIVYLVANRPDQDDKPQDPTPQDPTGIDDDLPF